MIGNTIRTQNPETASEMSSQLTYPAQHYELAGIKVDFSLFNTFDEVVEALQGMDEVGLHLVGSRDIAYRSEKMAEAVETFKEGLRNPLNILTRAGNLRATVIKLIKEEDSKND